MRPRARGWALAAGLALALLAPASPARAGERYYMIVFGAQRGLAEPQYTHSWAVFVRACGEGPCPDAYRLDAYVVSWLPQTMEIRLLALRPEPGWNVELHRTIRWALGTGQQVAKWGPYEIDRDLFCRAVRQSRRLSAGAELYKAVDTGYDSAEVSNCIHVLADLAEGRGRLRIASPGWGFFASYMITLRLEPWVLDSSQTHEWVAARLGLHCYPIQDRDIRRNPRSMMGLGYRPLRAFLP
jgi:hypothetical protein